MVKCGHNENWSADDRSDQADPVADTIGHFLAN